MRHAVLVKDVGLLVFPNRREAWEAHDALKAFPVRSVHRVYHYTRHLIVKKGSDPDPDDSAIAVAAASRGTETAVATGGGVKC